MCVVDVSGAFRVRRKSFDRSVGNITLRHHVSQRASEEIIGQYIWHLCINWRVCLVRAFEFGKITRLRPAGRTELGSLKTIILCEFITGIQRSCELYVLMSSRVMTSFSVFCIVADHVVEFRSSV